MRTLIVDDEPAARRRLRSLLATREDVVCVGEATSVAEAVAQIEALDPDLVLLDVSMRDGTGFDVLARTALRGAVVFVTAFDEYAVKAFEVSAIDYVLKPVFPERLHRAIDKATRRPARADHVCLTARDGERFVPASSIAFLRAEDDYTEVVLVDGTSYLCPVTMRTWETRLRDGFLRIHRSVMVNAQCIEKIDGRAVYLRGVARTFPIGRTYYADVRMALRGAKG